MDILRAAAGRALASPCVRFRQELAITEARDSTDLPDGAEHMTTAAAPTPVTVRANPTEFVLAILGFIALLLAIPFVLLLGGPFSGWLLGAVLFAGSWFATRFIMRVSEGLDPTQAVGLTGISSIGRAIVVVMILFVVALKVDKTVGLVAGGVFAAAFTFDLMGRTTLFAIREKQRKSARGEMSR
jgi:hypothetical protein